MTISLPPLFLERLKKIIPDKYYTNVIESFSGPKPLSVRINTLKIDKNKALDILKERGVTFKEVSWVGEALILEGIDPVEFGKMDLVSEGAVYRQGLSSMLPVVVLDPTSAERVLDMCAAPGSKVTQIAARMGNKGEITGLEAVRGRYYKLRSVAQLLGATNISFHLMDARRFRRKDQLFDKILVDAPCSSEGRFKSDNPKSFAYWSPRKIKEMKRKQRGLLLAASRLLRPGGILVYSTCTFAPEENEDVVQWLLKKTGGVLHTESIDIPEVATYPVVKEWNKRKFSEQTVNCFRVLPNRDMEGFFIAKMIRRI